MSDQALDARALELARIRISMAKMGLLVARLTTICLEAAMATQQNERISLIKQFNEVQNELHQLMNEMIDAAE